MTQDDIDKIRHHVAELVTLLKMDGDGLCRHRPGFQANGHDPVHQGLQKHSIGDTYPWAVVGIGNGDKVHYEVHNLCTGQKVYMHLWAMLGVDRGDKVYYAAVQSGIARNVRQRENCTPFRYDLKGALERAQALKQGRRLPDFMYLA